MTNPKGRVLQEHFSQTHDYLLVFAKDAEFAEMSRPKTEEEVQKDYTEIDENGERFRTLELRNTHKQFGKFNRANLHFPLYVDPKSGAVFLESDKKRIEVLPNWDDGFEGCWTWDRNKVTKDNNLLVGKQVSGSWKIYRKSYANSPDGDVARKKLKTIWLEREYQTEVGQKELDDLMGDRVFPSPKPTGLIKTLLSLVTHKDESAIILDFFSGTATTAHAILSMNAIDNGNRKFILVQLPEPIDDTTQYGKNAVKKGYKVISDISKERIRRVVKKLTQRKPGEFNLSVKHDFGFKSLKLERSNFDEWESFEGKKLDQLELKFTKAETPLIEGWTPENLLSEILLLQGFPLDSRVASLPEFKANTVQQVTSEFVGHHLYVCLDKKVKAETVAKLSLRAEDILVCLDSALSDEAKVNLADRCNLKVI